jgi:hypothetical protein
VADSWRESCRGGRAGGIGRRSTLLLVGMVGAKELLLLVNTDNRRHDVVNTHSLTSRLGLAERELIQRLSPRGMYDGRECTAPRAKFHVCCMRTAPGLPCIQAVTRNTCCVRTARFIMMHIKAWEKMWAHGCMPAWVLTAHCGSTPDMNHHAHLIKDACPTRRFKELLSLGCD